MADQLKNKGNALFSAGDYRGAVAAFTEAIEIDAANHVLFSNRSAAYASLSEFDKALEDAEKTVSLNPSWAKGYSRLGTALHRLHRLDESIEAYEKGLELDPQNAALREGLESVNNELDNSFGGGADGGAAGAGGGFDFGKLFSGMGGLGGLFNADTINKLKTNPKVGQLLADPEFAPILADVQKNPQNVNKYLSNPKIMTLMTELLGASLGGFGGAGGGGFNPFATQAAAQSDHNNDHDHDHCGGSCGSGSGHSHSHSHQEEEEDVEEVEEVEEVSAEEMEKKERKQKAESLKEAGNELYKQKKFTEAIEKYNSAIALDDENMAFYTNRAAVFFETKEYAKCIEDCETAVDVGRRFKADFKMIAKAYARAANAYVKQQDYDNGIRYFQKSLTESRNDQVFRSMKAAERERDEAAQRAYFSEEKALEAKERGNELFKQGEYPEAIKQYSEGLKRNPNEHTLYSNRAAAYMKLLSYPSALTDIERCLDLKPDFVRGWARKGQIQFGMKEFHKAMSAYQEGLKIDPNNEELLDGMRKVASAINDSSSSGEKDEERVRRAMADPEIQAIMSDPQMQNVLQEMGTDPTAASRYLGDERIRNSITKLIAAGILRTK